MLKDTGYRTKFQTFLLRTFTRSRLSLSGLAPKQDNKSRNIVEFTHLVSALGTEGLQLKFLINFSFEPFPLDELSF